MDTGTIIIVALVLLFIIYLVDKNTKMMKYKTLYEDALKAKNKAKALQFGRLYHRYRTGASAKHSSNAELIIANDLKAAGIN